MLNQPTIEKPHVMKLHGMADAFRAQLETTEAGQLNFEERFAMLVDQQWLWKENRALAQKACRDGFSVLHKKMAELFRELAVADVDGSIGRLLLKLARVDILLLDDFAMAPLKGSERRDFLEICDDRYQRHSMILTSQMPIAHWHEQIGDPTLADSILDRLVHNAYRIELNGESLRKKRGRRPDEAGQ